MAISVSRCVVRSRATLNVDREDGYRTNHRKVFALTSITGFKSTIASELPAADVSGAEIARQIGAPVSTVNYYRRKGQLDETYSRTQPKTSEGEIASSDPRRDE